MTSEVFIQPMVQSMVTDLSPSLGLDVLNLEELMLFFQHDMGYTTDSEDDVSTWTSQDSGAYEATQATQSKKPAKATDEEGVNNHTALRFDGIGDHLKVSQAINFNGISIAFKTGMSALSGDQVLVGLADEASLGTGSTNDYWELGIDSDGRVYVESSETGSVTRIKTKGILTLETEYVVTVEKNGANLTIDINDNAQTLDASSSVLPGDLANLDNFTIAARVDGDGDSSHADVIIANIVGLSGTDDTAAVIDDMVSMFGASSTPTELEFSSDAEVGSAVVGTDTVV